VPRPPASNDDVISAFLDRSLLYDDDTIYWDSDKSLARAGRKQANVSVRMA